MVTAIQSLTVILMSVLLSAKIAVNGSKPPCRPNAIVNLTGEEPDSSGSVHRSGFVFPPESMWTENNGLFGCGCYSDQLWCEPECCPVGHAMNSSGCFKDSYTSHILNNSESDRESHPFLDDRCVHMANTSVIKRYLRMENGQLMLRSGAAKFDLGEYCLFREENSRDYSAMVCTENKIEKPMSLPISAAVSSLNISMLFALATFIVYTLIPELKNLQGSMLRSYLASYIICIIFLTVILSGSALPTMHLYLCIIVAVTDYFGVACLMWLNVMSLDIWRKFRRIQSSTVVNIKQRQKATFIRYSVFVWVGSAMPPSITCVYSLFIPEDSRLDWLWWGSFLWPLAAIPVCNISLFAATALKIKQRRKKTANLVVGVNKHHQQNKQWFNLYVKLFLIMGGPLIFWAIAFFWLNPRFFDFVCVLEALQGISIFYTFIWKDDVKRLLRKQYDKVLLRILAFICRYRSTPEMEN